MDKHEIYYKASLKHAKRGVNISQDLTCYNPYEVYLTLTTNNEVIKWLKFISNYYIPRKAKILLIYPCSADKPYHESRSYKILFKTLAKLKERRKEIHLMTISEPFGLVPEEFYGVKTPWHDWSKSWYDCPGLFEWWCRKHGQPYSKEFLEKSIQILADYIAKFFIRVKELNIYSKIIAFVRTFSSKLEVRYDYTHRRIIELAASLAKIRVDLLPPKEIVAEIVLKKGRFAWDMYGVSHPMAQNYLLNYLKRCC
jgi:archaeosine synthase